MSSQPFGPGLWLIIVQVRGMVLDPAGFDPSPSFEARIVCHDPAGAPARVSGL